MRRDACGSSLQHFVVSFRQLFSFDPFHPLILLLFSRLCGKDEEKNVMYYPRRDIYSTVDNYSRGW